MGKEREMSKRYKLFLGDCLEVMKKIPDNKVDCIITDPPYLHVKGGMKSKKFNTGSWKVNSYVNNDMSDFDRTKIFSFLDLAIQKMKKANLYVFCSRLQLYHYLDWVEINKKKYDVLIWDKQVKTVKNSKFFQSDIEYVVRIYESGVSLNKITDDNGKALSHFYTKLQSYKQPKGEHETIKPIELIQKYVLLSSNENDIILDPFMGSGTTGLACINTNRKFIGIEKEEKYFNIAKERIEKAEVENE